jgi:hypothetical protein
MSIIKNIFTRRPAGKGQSVLLTHALLVGFTVFLIYAITTTFVTLREDYQGLVGNNEVNQLCYVMKSAVDKIYANNSYTSPTTTMIGYMDVNMPVKISDMPYRARFVNDSIFVQSINRGFNQTCKIGLPVSYNGTTNGGPTRFIYTIYSNGTKTIELVKL